MRTRVYQNSWGGRAEHGFRFIEIEEWEHSITIYIVVKDYCDWGGKSQIEADYEQCLTIPTQEPLTRELLFEYIIEAGKILDETYLLPKSVDELNYHDDNVFI